MPTIPLTQTLRTEYENLFNSCTVQPAYSSAVGNIVAKLLANKTRYQSLGDQLGIPWGFVAVIHNMESNLSFTKHLHNGDPLTARTVQVPAGRPKDGNPPFTWEASATDALLLKGVGAQTDWSLAGTLYQIERYNGWGYRLYHPTVPSPYLWSFSNHYTSGKYVADGKWSDTAVSQQCGAALLLKRLTESGQFSFAGLPAQPSNTPPVIVSYSMHKSADPLVVKQSQELQRWLNTFPGIAITTEGIPGDNTSAAYKKVTGSYLPGDPRG